MISKYDLYVGSNSQYYYSDADVLINKLNIKDENKLKTAEAEISFVRQIELQEKPIKMEFDFKHLVVIHKYLLSDIYEFAGKIRNEDISKSGFKFCLTEYIVPQLDELFEKFKEEQWCDFNENDFIEKIAYYLSELNVIHPFREGNGRAMREFIREFALSNEYVINWSKVPTTRIMDAMIESVVDVSELILCLKDCVE